MCDVASGVPQGSVLGLLFLVFINDLVGDQEVHARLFADDCLIFTEVHAASDQEKLNRFLTRIDEWCATWQMSLNLKKKQYV